ncbi:MAG: peptidylprolyl isomerase [Desulfovibrio sp.]|jgi:peptidyl-prolyl cis-trans isomerase SurA|nr:peptidylprolyl isomerase [Desulfovibrio sp.]
MRERESVKKIFPLLAAALLCAVAAAHAAQLNKVAAVVNGQVITMVDLQKAALPELARARINPENPAQADAAREILGKVLDLMIMDILLGQEAARLKVNVASSEVDNELAKMMRARNFTKEQFEAQLAAQKISLSEIRKNMEKSLLRQKIMGMAVGRRVVVRPEEISAYYESHKNELYNREGLQWGFIVYHPQADGKSLAAKVKSGSLSFGETARKYSIAPNKDKGGIMGPVLWENINPDLETRLAALKPGETSDVFDIANEGMTFKAQVRLFRPGGGEEKPLTLEEATPRIDALLREPKARERFEEYAAGLKNKAIIDIRL